MTSSTFAVTEENPNDTTGGKGCLCYPRGGDETRGPYLVFPGTTTDDNLSPHAVLCEHCAVEGFCVAEEPVIDLPEDEVEELPEERIVVTI